MKFTFEIPDEEFEFFDSEEFKDRIRCGVIEGLVNYFGHSVETLGITREIVKEHKQEIVEQILSKVVDNVTDTIARKKEIMEVTPKVSELAKINKDNEQYFIGLIDKAIAKRFK